MIKLFACTYMLDNQKTIDDLFTQMDVPRTASEMNEYFYQVFDIVQSSESLQDEARLKKGLFKKFLEEFYPLFCFSQSRFYEKESKLNIVLGNQGYDAIITNAEGSKQLFEITSFIDGELHYKNALKMNRDGYSYTIPLSQKVHDTYKQNIIENLFKKSLKDYSGISLLLVIDTSLYFEVINKDSSFFVNDLINDIKKMKLSFNEIFLLQEVGNTKYHVDKHIFKIR